MEQHGVHADRRSDHPGFDNRDIDDPPPDRIIAEFRDRGSMKGKGINIAGTLPKMLPTMRYPSRSKHGITRGAKFVASKPLLTRVEA